MPTKKVAKKAAKKILPSKLKVTGKAKALTTPVTYSSIIQDTHKKCGGKSSPKYGDILEFSGHLATRLASGPVALKAFLALGKRRLTQKKK